MISMIRFSFCVTIPQTSYFRSVLFVSFWNPRSVAFDSTSGQLSTAENLWYSSIQPPRGIVTCHSSRFLRWKAVGISPGLASLWLCLMASSVFRRLTLWLFLSRAVVLGGFPPVCGVCLCHPTRKGGSPHIPVPRSRKGYIIYIGAGRECSHHLKRLVTGIKMGIFPVPKIPGLGNQDPVIPDMISLVLGTGRYSFSVFLFLCFASPL